MVNDTRFFTKEEGGPTLYDRFKTTPAHTGLFDVPVGCFRSSGFHMLLEEFAGM